MIGRRSQCAAAAEGHAQSIERTGGDITKDDAQTSENQTALERFRMATCWLTAHGIGGKSGCEE